MINLDYQLFRHIAEFTSEDALKAALQYVRLRAISGGVQITATDGFAVAMALDKTGHMDRDEALIQVRDEKDKLFLPKKKSFKDIEIDNENISILSSKEKQMYPATFGSQSYPNVDNVLPSYPREDASISRMAIDLDLLYRFRFLGGGPLLRGGTPVSLVFSGEKTVIAIAGHFELRDGSDAIVYGIVMPMTAQEPLEHLREQDQSYADNSSDATAYIRPSWTTEAPNITDHNNHKTNGEE